MILLCILNLEMNFLGIILFTPHLDIANLEASLQPCHRQGKEA